MYVPPLFSSPIVMPNAGIANKHRDRIRAANRMGASPSRGPSYARMTAWPDLSDHWLHTQPPPAHHTHMKKALLVVDIQDSFKIDPARWASRNNPRFEENVTELIRAFREASQPIIWVLHNDSDPGLRPGDPEVRLTDVLDRREGATLIQKNTRNAFTSTDLQARRDALGV